MTENRLEPKNCFHSKIEKYYSELAGNLIPAEILHDLINKITDTQYNNYCRFWDKYPKSRKRYSELKMDDLDHPFTHYEITDFLKKRAPINYQEFSKILLKMNDEELNEYEIRKLQYETK